MNFVNRRFGRFFVFIMLLGLFLLAGIIVLPARGQTNKDLAESQARMDEAQAPAVNHNTWTTGASMPTPRMGAAAGAIGANIYVVGGTNSSGAILGVNEVYNPKKNTWKTGASDPNPRSWPAYAVVNKILYVFGGSNGSFLDLTESYNPATDTWTTLAPVPYAQQGALAVADKDVIYVMGGYNNSGGYLTNVASYNTTTNTWTEESPLLVGKNFFAAGLLGTTVVAAAGQNESEVLGDNEGYSTKKGAWSELAADPTPRIVACSAAIKGELYAAGGTDGNGEQLALTESYRAKTKSWTTLAPMPNGVWNAAGSAEAGGKLYCFGGGQYLQTDYDYVQIYQP